MTEIKPIQKGYDVSYVKNRPFEGTRQDYGNRELEGLEINPINKELIEEIKIDENQLNTYKKEILDAIANLDK